MKIKGQKIQPPPEQILVIPRNDEEGKEAPIVFKAKAILDYSEFEQLCPVPIVPRITEPDKPSYEDPTDPDYKKEITKRQKQRYCYMVLKSLESTGIEWEQVVMSKPETWELFEKELETSGLLPSEINRIYDLVITANSMDQKLLDEAKKRFILGAAVVKQ